MDLRTQLQDHLGSAFAVEREILLAVSLQQASIVPVLTAGKVGGLPYFTMPFIEGAGSEPAFRACEGPCCQGRR